MHQLKRLGSQSLQGVSGDKRHKRQAQERPGVAWLFVAGNQQQWRRGHCNAFWPGMWIRRVMDANTIRERMAGDGSTRGRGSVQSS